MKSLVFIDAEKNLFHLQLECAAEIFEKIVINHLIAYSNVLFISCEKF